MKNSSRKKPKLEAYCKKLISLAFNLLCLAMHHHHFTITDNDAVRVRDGPSVRNHLKEVEDQQPLRGCKITPKEGPKGPGGPTKQRPPNGRPATTTPLGVHAAPPPPVYVRTGNKNNSQFTQESSLLSSSSE